MMEEKDRPGFFDGQELHVTQDLYAGVITIEGQNFTYGFFRGLGGVGNCGLAIGQIFQIIKREDGVITITTLDQQDPRRQWFT